MQETVNLDFLLANVKPSKCLDQHVYAVLVNEQGIPQLSASNMPNAHCVTTGMCQKLKGNACLAEHAEVALLVRMAREDYKPKDTDVVIVTLQPCSACLRALANSGIKTVRYTRKRLAEMVVPEGMTCTPIKAESLKVFNLSEVFQKIKEYQAVLNEKRLEPVTKLEAVDWAKEIILSLFSEVAEVLNTMDWKYWKQTRGEIAYEHFKEEMADVFFFWIELLTLFDVSQSEIEQKITEKLFINYNRMNGEQK